MACCKGTASWFCCYPDSCGCDCGGCQDPSSCSNCICFPNADSQGNVCNESPVCPAGCGHTPTVMTKAACCSCNSGQWGYAWPGCGACGFCPSCGDQLGFSTDCNLYRYPTRVDTGPSSGYMTDFTKALFMTWAPLSQGILTNVRATDNDTCC